MSKNKCHSRHLEAVVGKVPPPAQLGNGINTKQGINNNELLLASSL